MKNFDVENKSLIGKNTSNAKNDDMIRISRTSFYYERYHQDNKLRLKASGTDLISAKISKNLISSFTHGLLLIEPVFKQKIRILNSKDDLYWKGLIKFRKNQ